MQRLIGLDELRDRLNLAQQRLTHEKITILTLYPLEQTMPREAYLFAYRRAERMGLRAIRKRTEALSWLPMRLDPKSETEGSGRAARNAWLSGQGVFPPTSVDFGNDFMHIIARVALRFGWDSPYVTATILRISRLFHNLSLLVGLAFYCAQMTEMQVESVTLSQPDDLDTTTAELAAMMPSVYEAHHAMQAQPASDDRSRLPSATRWSADHLPPYMSVIEGGLPSSPDSRF